MPTGYTQAVQDGKITTLRDYALCCARAFGALVMMRDDPMDAPIPERFDPNTSYHDDKIAAARSVLDEVPELSVAECNKRAGVEYEASLESYCRYTRERDEQKCRYEAMLAKVEQWRVPDDLVSLKDFMLEQLCTSIKGDCQYEPERPTRLSAEAWRETKLASASHNLAYQIKARDEEITRTEGRNKWLASLRAALPEA